MNSAETRASLLGMTRSATWAPLLFIASACGKAATKQTIPPLRTASAAPAPVATQAMPPPTAPHIGVSDDIARQCRLRFANVQAAPKFGYNDEELLPADRDLLQQVADCLTQGPLKDAKVDLVGRTDPRGTDEYNLALGNRRAYSVRTYLQRLGVSAERLLPATRGELDATGVEESGWRTDRRVDLQLAK